MSAIRTSQANCLGKELDFEANELGGWFWAQCIESHKRSLKDLKCFGLVMEYSIPFTDSSLYEFTKVNWVFESIESLESVSASVCHRMYKQVPHC